MIVLEPSKVGAQHITLINPYLEAAIIASARPVEFWCAASMWKNVASELKLEITHHEVPVVDPISRQFWLKIPVEIFVTLWVLFRKRPDDILLITCLFSPTLYVLSRLCGILRPRNVYVVLHGETEALFDCSISSKITGYGYWFRKFWKNFQKDNFLQLIVIEEFIKTKLLSNSDGKLTEDCLHVLNMPVQMISQNFELVSRVRDRPKVCFIGYRSPLKGFDVFSQLAVNHPEFTWLAIGEGQIFDLLTHETTMLMNSDSFQTAISGCDIAVFPYKAGYEASLSAALLDALSCGLHIIASPRGCFLAVRDVLGYDCIQCADGPKEISAALCAWWQNRHDAGFSDLSDRIGTSRFSQTKLNSQMRALVEVSSYDQQYKGNQ